MECLRKYVPMAIPMVLQWGRDETTELLHVLVQPKQRLTIQEKRMTTEHRTQSLLKVTVCNPHTGKREDATPRRWSSGLAASIFMAGLPEHLNPMIEKA